MLKEHETLMSGRREGSVMKADDILRNNSSPFMVRDVNWWISESSESFTTEVLFENLNGESIDPYGTLTVEKTERTSKSFVDSVNMALKDAAHKISPRTDKAQLTRIDTDIILISKDGQPMFEITAKFDLEDDKQLTSRYAHESSTYAMVSALIKGYQAICAINT